MRDPELEKELSRNKISEDKKTILKSFFDYLPTTNQDWLASISILVLFILWVVSWIIPDPIPAIDEIVLPVLTLLVTQWYTNKKNKESQ